MSDEPATPAQPDNVRWLSLAVVMDTALLLVFAAVGRSSHEEGLSPAGVLATAWPFLVGGALGWALTRAWRAPRSLWPTGVGVWLAAVVVGMALRRLTGDGTATPFVVVATVTVGTLLLSWRAVAQVLSHRAAQPSGTQA